MAKKAATKRKSNGKATNGARAVLVGNSSYGLYIGYTDTSDADIIATKAVRLANIRHP